MFGFVFFHILVIVQAGSRHSKLLPSPSPASSPGEHNQSPRSQEQGTPPSELRVAFPDVPFPPGIDRMGLTSLLSLQPHGGTEQVSAYEVLGRTRSSSPSASAGSHHGSAGEASSVDDAQSLSLDPSQGVRLVPPQQQIFEHRDGRFLNLPPSERDALEHIAKFIDVSASDIRHLTPELFQSISRALPATVPTLSTTTTSGRDTRQPELDRPQRSQVSIAYDEPRAKALLMDTRVLFYKVQSEYRDWLRYLNEAFLKEKYSLMRSRTFHALLSPTDRDSRQRMWDSHRKEHQTREAQIRLHVSKFTRRLRRLAVIDESFPLRQLREQYAQVSGWWRELRTVPIKEYQDLMHTLGSAFRDGLVLSEPPQKIDWTESHSKKPRALVMFGYPLVTFRVLETDKIVRMNARWGRQIQSTPSLDWVKALDEFGYLARLAKVDEEDRRRKSLFGYKGPSTPMAWI